MVASDCMIAAVILWLQVVALAQLLSYGFNWTSGCNCYLSNQCKFSNYSE